MSAKKTIRLPDNLNKELLEYMERSGKNQSDAIASLINASISGKREKLENNQKLEDILIENTELSKKIDKLGQNDKSAKFAFVSCIAGFLNLILLISFAVQIF